MRTALTLALLFLSSCASKPVLPPGPSQAELNDSNSAEAFFIEETGPSQPVSQTAEIRPGFLLSIKSPVDKSLTIKTRVRLEGDAELPYDLRWVVAGTSVSHLATKLNDHFRPLYKVPPQISVEVEEQKYFIEVRGLVEKAGPLLVNEREQIEDILRRSGERKSERAAGFVQIRRGENTYNIDLGEYFQGRGLDRSPRWYGGEKILFLRASTSLSQDQNQSIQFIGDVKTPGPLAFKKDANFYHYLLKAGGTNPTSDLTRVEVVRQTSKGPATTEASAIEIAKNIKLEPGDTIILSSNLPGRTERQLQFASVMASIISALCVLAIAL